MEINRRQALEQLCGLGSLVFGGCVGDERVSTKEGYRLVRYEDIIRNPNAFVDKSVILKGIPRRVGFVDVRKNNLVLGKMFRVAICHESGPGAFPGICCFSNLDNARDYSEVYDVLKKRIDKNDMTPIRGGGCVRESLMEGMVKFEMDFMDGYGRRYDLR